MISKNADTLRGLGVDEEEIRNQHNIVRLRDRTAIKIAVLDALYPGEASKPSLVAEAVDAYYREQVATANTSDPLDSIANELTAEEDSRQNSGGM